MNQIALADHSILFTDYTFNDDLFNNKSTLRPVFQL